jgi:hypothetical protein
MQIRRFGAILENTVIVAKSEPNRLRILEPFGFDPNVCGRPSGFAPLFTGGRLRSPFGPTYP